GLARAVRSTRARRGKETAVSEFLYLYRLPADSGELPGSPKNMQERLQKWTAWFKELEARGHLSALGHPLENGGAVVKEGGGAVHDRPYGASKGSVVGEHAGEGKD